MQIFLNLKLYTEGNIELAFTSYLLHQKHFRLAWQKLKTEFNNPTGVPLTHKIHIFNAKLSRVRTVSAH